MTATPIPNELVAALVPSEQEIDAAEHATFADEVRFKGEEARLKCEFVLRISCGYKVSTRRADQLISVSLLIGQDHIVRRLVDDDLGKT